jgi:hypothetical protein
VVVVLGVFSSSSSAAAAAAVVVVFRSCDELVRGQDEVGVLPARHHHLRLAHRAGVNSKKPISAEIHEKSLKIT